jgi:hypothetical protein
MPHPKPEINSKGWRRQSLPELEQYLLRLRRAAEFHHYPEVEWRFIDRVKKRINALRREAGI